MKEICVRKENDNESSEMDGCIKNTGVGSSGLAGWTGSLCITASISATFSIRVLEPVGPIQYLFVEFQDKL